MKPSISIFKKISKKIGFWFFDKHIKVFTMQNYISDSQLRQQPRHFIEAMQQDMLNELVRELIDKKYILIEHRKDVATPGTQIRISIRVF